MSELSAAAMALAMLVGTSPTQTALAEREQLVRSTLAEFYECLLGDAPVSGCPAILTDVEAALSELTPSVRAALNQRDATAALWQFLRDARTALSVTELRPPYRNLNLRFVTSRLGGIEQDDITIELVGGSNTGPVQSTGLRKIVSMGLSWDHDRKAYLVSGLGLSVNGVILLRPNGQPAAPPEDLWKALGFEERPRAQQ